MALEDLLLPMKGAYRASPEWVKATLGRLYALLPMRVRHGRVYVEAARFLDESQWWSWEQHRAYQWEQMQRLLRHAYTNVPYYRRGLDEAGVSPADICSQDDWHRLPLLSKDAVRENTEELIAGNMRHLKLPNNTGGSTGRTLELFWERGRTRSLERAFMNRQWAWAGFRFGERTAMLRGQSLKRGQWYYDPINRHLFIDAYNLSSENGAAIVRKLREFQPVSIQAYPSNLATLALWMKEQGEPPIAGLKTVLCGSENLYPEQKQLFQEIFQARIYSWFGHGEVSCLAGFCEKQDYYHVYSEYGYTELVDADGTALPWTEGQRGEIVTTGLINNTMPLIRYCTGDIAVAGPSECTCGRRYRLLAKIEGRKQEYVITADGRPIALTGLVFGLHWNAFSHIRQVQLEQNEPGQVLVRIARRPSFTERDECEIREKMLGAVHSGLNVTFDYVESIPLTHRGKHVFLKQSLPLPSAWAGTVDVRHDRTGRTAAP